MTMNRSSCIAGCLDVQSPANVSFLKLYQWPESEAEFLRKLSMKQRTSASSPSSSSWSSPSSSSSLFNSERSSSAYNHEGLAWRQRYLRSYTFSRKESVAQRTKKWLKEKQKTKSKKCKRQSTSGGSCCRFLDGVFKFLLFCVAKVDVYDEQRRPCFPKKSPDAVVLYF